MNKNPVFLGIYTKIFTAGRPKASSKNRWHVWGLDGGQFLVQEIRPEQKTKEPAQELEAAEFFSSFRVHAAFSANGKHEIPEKAPTHQAPQAGDKAPLDQDPPGLNIFAPDEEDDEDEEDGLAAEPNSFRPLQDQDPLYAAREKSSAQTTFSQDESGQGDADKPEAPPAADLNQLEEQMRSDFSLALIRLQTNRALALENLHKLAESQGGFRTWHKFMFTDFGTALRRRKLYSLALRFHQRANLLAPDDEHILFNMARVLFDSGQVDNARSCLEEAVSMARDFKAGSDFLTFIDGKDTRR